MTSRVFESKTILRVFISAIVCIALSLVFLTGCSKVQSLILSSASQNSDVPVSEFQEATVVRVVDGDTIIVNYDSSDYKVRLDGIDCPESVHSDETKNTPEGQMASDFTKSVVASGQTVYLQTDVNTQDKYGRELRYVWLEIPSDGATNDSISSLMLNAIIVKNGFAEAREWEPNVMYADVLESLEAQARDNNAGVSYYWVSSN